MKKKSYLVLELPGLEKIVIENPSDNILFCESDDKEVDIFLKDGTKYTIVISLKKLKSMLDMDIFFSPHYSFIINMQYVVSYKKANRGLLATLENNIKIPVSKRLRNDFLKLILHFPLITLV